jgi:hypothetical protein
MDNRKEITIFAWQYKTDELIGIIKSNQYHTINLYFYHEYEISFENYDIESFINKFKIKINAITISEPSKYNKFYQKIDKSLLDLEIWQTFWLNRTHLSTLNENEWYRKIDKNQYRYKFTKPFASFNGKHKYHRTILIDKLFEYNFFNKGTVTYHLHNSIDDTYIPKFYDNQKITIADNYENDGSSYNFSEEFLKSFLHIPTETTVDSFVLSEKTATPILCKLPFLTVGSVGYHRDLEKLGFKLYDEIFDYSFDLEEDVEKRIILLTKNIKFVIDNSDKINLLHDKIKDKLEYNRNRAIEIISDYNFVPKKIQTLYEHLKNVSHVSGEEQELVDIAKFFKNFKMPDKTYINSPVQLVYDLWHNFNIKDVEDEIENYRPKKVIILGENEWEPWTTPRFQKIVNKHNIEVIYTIGGPKSNFYTNLAKSFKINNFDLQHWPTFHLVYAYQRMKELDIKFTNSFGYSFICLNNRDHEHRCALIDHLEKYRLINSNNVVTWHSFLKENLNYQFEYFDQRTLKLDDDFDKKLDSYLIPKQYFESFFDVVSECTAKTIMVSEKTVKPLFYKKPFIVFGAAHFHKYLKELGFELYDEIIDYSFDNETDLRKRADLFAKEVKKINDINSIKARKKTYKSLQNKINKNFEVLLSLISNKGFIPDQVKLLMLDVNNFDHHHYITKYREILSVMENKKI